MPTAISKQGEPTRRRRVGPLIAGLALMCSLAVTGWVGAALAGSDAWLTPGRPLRREPATAARGCSWEGQSNLRAIVDGERAWLLCGPGDGAMSEGGLAQVDPGAGVLRLRWPVGPDGPRLMQARAALPGPDGRLAVVYRASSGGRSAGLAVGVAGPDGWARPPELVEGEVRHAVLGLAWVGDELQVALRRPGPPEDGLRGDPFVMRVPARGAISRVPRSRATICGELGDVCIVYGAYRPQGEPWRFVISGVGRWGGRRSIEQGGLGGGPIAAPRGDVGRAPEGAASAAGGEPEQAATEEGGTAWLWTVAADGGDRRPLQNRPFERSGRDMAAAGLPADLPASMVGFVLRPDGSWVDPAPPPAAAAGLEPHGGVFEISDGAQRTRLRWTNPGAALRSIGRHVEGRWIIVTQGVSGAGLAIAVAAGTGRPPQPVARLVGPNLLTGLALERPDGGFYLTTDDVAVALDASGRRADPLGPFAHLEAVGTGALQAAWWALVGLVPCLLLAYSVLGGADRLLARRKGRAPRGWHALWAPSLALGAAAHALTALSMLEELQRAIGPAG